MYSVLFVISGLLSDKPSITNIKILFTKICESKTKKRLDMKKAHPFMRFRTYQTDYFYKSKPTNSKNSLNVMGLASILFSLSNTNIVGVA
jgi:hypothetical protein